MRRRIFVNTRPLRYPHRHPEEVGRVWMIEVDGETHMCREVRLTGPSVGCYSEASDRPVPAKVWLETWDPVETEEGEL